MEKLPYTLLNPEADLSHLLKCKLDLHDLLRQYDGLEKKPDYTFGDINNICLLPTVTTATTTGGPSLAEVSLRIGYVLGYSDGKETASDNQVPDDKEDK